MNTVFDVVDFGLLLLDPQGRVVRANRWIQERCRSAAMRAGQPLETAFGEPVEPRTLMAVRGCLDLGNAVRLSQAFHPMPLPLYPRGGGDARLRQAVDIMPVRLEDDGPRHALLQVRDVTESVRREQVLRQQARQLGLELGRLTDAQQEVERQSLRFREIARLAPVGLFETDAQGRVGFFNGRAAEMLALRPGSAPNPHWTCALAEGGVDTVALQARWQATVGSGKRFAEEFCLHTPGREPAWLRMESSPLLDGAASLQGCIFTLVDVTEFHENVQRTEFRASHDPLTGLANRERFQRRLQALLDGGVLTRAQGGAQPGLAVMFIDLDCFKPVNDHHGHAAGDIVLKAVAARLQRCVRSDDLVARMGGDEFAVLVGAYNDDAVLERIARAIRRAVAQPINIGRCHVQVGASIGWACAPHDGADPHALLETADRAMYRVKRSRGEPAAAADAARIHA